jgi:hypothetical protein
MTSTIFNPYVDPATVGSKTGYFKESPGETLDSNRGGVSKTVGVRMARAINDLLPYNLRPMKANHRRARAIPNLRHEVYTLRLVWRSHRRPALLKKIQLIKEMFKNK